MINANKKVRSFLYNFTPAILLFTSVLNKIDFNNLEFKYFSFNFAYILIFYYSLKRESGIGYISIFFAGLFNDVVNGTPMGISSLCYLLSLIFISSDISRAVRRKALPDFFSLSFCLCFCPIFHNILRDISEDVHFETLHNLRILSSAFF